MQPPMYDPNAGYNPAADYDPTGTSPPAPQQTYMPQGPGQADWNSGGSSGGKGNSMLTISIIVLLVLGAAGGALYATDNMDVLPFIDDDEGPSPVGKWVDNSGTIIEFKSGGGVAFVDGDPEDIDYDWSTSGNTFTLEMEMDGEDGVMTYTSKWKYDIISDDDHGDILYMSQREVIMEEGGESSTQTFDDGGDCMFLVKESALPEGWDDDTMDDIAEDIDPPSWCNMDFEDQYENQADDGRDNLVFAHDEINATTNDTDDYLIELGFIRAYEDLNWAFVDITITVNGTDYECGFDGNDECQIYEGGTVDTYWSMDETVLLREGGTDIVSEGGNEVSITIYYKDSQLSGSSSFAVE